MNKSHIHDLALFGGQKMFPRPVSTSNLVKPDVEQFLALLKPALNANGESALIKQLETELAEFHQVPHCVAVCSGFWALVLAIKALALPGKTEVIMPSLTYRRLADVVAWTGLIPRFCEVDPATLAISAATAAPHIGPDTALIIGVHPIVNCCDAPGLEQLGEKHGIPVLFDGVESVYETLNGKKIGGFGAAECFSFHASKLINGFEGGYITTRDAALARTLRTLSDPSACEGEPRLSAALPGGPLEPPPAPSIETRLPAVHAAMALQGLREVHGQISHNREIYHTYKTRLAAVRGLELLQFNEGEPTSFKNIVVGLNNDWPLSRELTIEVLNSEGILTRAYYSPPLHLRPVKYPTIQSPLPFTEQAAKRYMLMPSGYQVNVQQVEQVIDFLNWISAHAVEIRNTAGERP